MLTEIYKLGDDVSVVTNATSESDFIDTFTRAFQGMQGNGREHRQAMEAGFQIMAKLKGYKSDVQERRTLAAGRWPHPTESPIGGADVEP